ncbi:MAG TPA: sigma-70 family RNA polymerase sigma factor [Acidimicrobiia bacterium]|nr:sigma-70 family RNA polymerase sigma factor [Acidimicrobiia bacterium]
MVMIQGESLGQRAGTLPPPHDELVLVDAPNTDDTDNMLMARLRAGDELAFRALVDRHRPWLVRHCTRLLGHDAHAAEDAAQESLLKLHAAVLRGQPLRVRPWLSVVARNTCVDEQRRRRPDLPGELPERAVAGHDPFELDAALSDAWSRLAGRHREVLYLREVLGFSYKEIGAVMGLSMPATETLVFRARAALKREYERSGGTSFGSALLGFQLARLGLDGRRDATVTDGVARATVADPGFSSLTSRLAHFLSTTLPGCGEQAIAKVLSVAAGVVMAAAAVIPGVSPFVDRPSPADKAEAPMSAQFAGVSSVPSDATSPNGAEMRSSVTLKTLLGDNVADNWTPQRSRTEAPPAPAAAPPTTGNITVSRPTPLRDASDALRSEDRPTLRRDDSEPGPLRSILPDRPRRVDAPERPHPLRALLADPVPFLIDPLPVEDSPIDPGALDQESPGESTPAPTAPAPVDPTPGEGRLLPDRESRPTLREAVKDAEVPSDDNVAGHDPALLRRGDG